MKTYTSLLILLLMVPALGSDYNTLQSQLNAEQKELAIEMEKAIMAPCCFGGPVYSHGSNQMTEEIKVEIRTMILEGKDRDAMLDYFRAKIDPRTGEPYGNRILAAPKGDELVGQVSYWMIVAFAIVGLVLLWLAIMHLRKPATAVPEENEEEVDAELLDRIESDVAELEKD